MKGEPDYGNRKNYQPYFQPASPPFPDGAGADGNHGGQGKYTGLYPGRVGKAQRLSEGNRKEVLKYLEEKELIQRIPDEEDARFKKIVFTEEAEKIREVLRREIEQTEEILLRGISEEEREIFQKTAEKMLANLEEEEER